MINLVNVGVYYLLSVNINHSVRVSSYEELGTRRTVGGTVDRSILFSNTTHQYLLSKERRISGLTADLIFSANYTRNGGLAVDGPYHRRTRLVRVKRFYGFDTLEVNA